MTTNERRVKALGYGEQRIEALGQQPYVDFELKDGSTIRLPHPLRIDDAALARFEALQRGDGLDREPVLDDSGNAKIDPETGRPVSRPVEPPTINGKPAEPYLVRLMKAILGDEDYAKLVDHGLRAREIHSIWNDLAESDDEDEDEADPKGKRS